MSFTHSPGVTDFDGADGKTRRNPPVPARDSIAKRRYGGDQPTGVFVAIEMAVLVLVCALAIVSIIVSTGDVDPDRAPGVMTEQGMSHGPRGSNGADAARAADKPAAPR